MSRACRNPECARDAGDGEYDYCCNRCEDWARVRADGGVNPFHPDDPRSHMTDCNERRQKRES